MMHTNVSNKRNVFHFKHLTQIASRIHTEDFRQFEMSPAKIIIEMFHLDIIKHCDLTKFWLCFLIYIDDSSYFENDEN